MVFFQGAILHKEKYPASWDGGWRIFSLRRKRASAILYKIRNHLRDVDYYIISAIVITTQTRLVFLVRSSVVIISLSPDYV